MKKTLVALAALAATAAFAQSTVTIKGTVDAAYVNTTTTSTATAGDGKSSTTNLQNNKQGTSQVTFLGEEDLGGGLKALFLYEGDFDATNSATGGGHNLGNNGGEVYVGMSGGFGSIKLGSPNTPSLTAQGARTPFGTKTGGGFNGVSGTGHVRQSSSMVYASPNFSGFSAAIGVTTPTAAVAAVAAAAPTATKDGTAGTAAVASNTAAIDIGLNYANGPLSVNYSNFDLNTTTQNNLAVSYTFGPAKVTVGYFNEDTGGAAPTKTNGMNLALAYGITSNINLLANYGKLNDDTAANAAAPKDKSIGALGLQYVMSKRTSVYARYVNEGFDNAATTQNIKTTLVGLQHNF